ncbi:MAG: alpha/beta fold hydrolase [Chloroflexi bacterium]|nr:alpha/beta fold hydrolase [Chloroflexota bacterium]
MQTEKSFDTGELTLKYIEGGSGAPMVLLHGLTAQKLGWYSVFPEVSKHWHVYAPDLRGHGNSDRAPDNQYHNADYARDVIALLKFIGEPVVLVGHSLGAMTAIVTAAQYPEGVRDLVLLDPPLFTYPAGVRLHADSTHWFELVAAVMQDNPDFETVVARLREKMPEAGEQGARQTAEFVARVAAGTVETALRDELWQGVDLPAALQSIHCPTLLIHGDWDHGAAMRRQDVDFFRANCPAATVVHIPEADHGLNMQANPNVILEPINSFLQPA